MLLALQQRFLNAAFQPGGWVTALEALASATHSARAQVLGVGGPAEIPFNHIANLGDGRHIDEFIAIEGGNPEVNWRVALAAAPFTLVHEQQYREVQGAAKYNVYNDFANKYDMVHGCQTVLANEASGFLGLATLRTRADGVSSADDLALFDAVAPTVLKAVRLQQAVEHQGANLLAGTLEAMNAAAVLLGSAGTVIAMTPAAAALAGRQEVVAVRGRAIRAVDRVSDARLQAGIARVLASANGMAAGRLWLASPQGAMRGLVCELYGLPARDWNFGVAPTVLVSLRRIDGGDADAALLQHAFDLSPAEAEIAMLVAQGLSRDEIAARRRVSSETVASQIKAIFRKADVRRQTQLAAVVARLSGG